MTSPTSPVQREAKHEVNEAAPSESETGFLRKQILAYDLLTGEFDRPRSSAITPQPRHINVFLRMHRRLIGTVVVATDKHVDSSNDADKMLVSKIVHAAWQDHQSEIIAHLTSDGIAAPREENDLLTLPERANACKNALDALPGEEPFVTVAIATKSNADSCIETVRHIRENNFSNYEIVIVDNSVDDPEESAKLAAGLGSIEALRLIVEPRRGLSFARNTAYENARGKYVLFTDDDVKVDKIWIRTIVAIFEKDPSVACVTGSIISSEIETPAQAWLEQYGGYHKGFDTRIYDLDEHRSDYPLYPYDAGRFGSGANMAFRLDALSEIGGFSIDLGAGIPAHAGEDIDVLRRIVSAGHRLVYEPSAVLWHHHRRSCQAIQLQMFRYGAGLSATVTKWMLTDPRARRDMLSRIPIGVRHVFSPSSKKNKNKTEYFPRQLTRREQIGFLLGPLLYLKSRRISRRRDREYRAAQSQSSS